MRDSKVRTKNGFVNVHPTKGALCVAQRVERFFVSKRCPSIKLNTDFIIERNGK